MDRTLLPKLEDLGLAKKEAKVYLALLNHGSATADQAAKATALNRSTTYVIIKKLMSDGLVSQFKEGKKTKFNAESPLNLERLVEQQREEIKSREGKAKFLIPELLDIFASTGKRPLVRYFEGIEGLVSVREELLKIKSKYYYAVSSTDSLLKLFPREELIAWSKRRASKKIGVKMMYTFSGEQTKPIGRQQMLKIDESKFPFDSDLYIYDNSVSFVKTSGHIGGIIIESSAIAQTMRSIFEIVWASNSEKIDK